MNVKVYVYSLISPWVQQTSQFTFLVLDWYTLLYSLIASGENLAFDHFAAAIANHYSSAFSVHQVPITAEWTEVAWHERFARHLYIWLAAWLEHQLVIGGHPSKY